MANRQRPSLLSDPDAPRSHLWSAAVTSLLVHGGVLAAAVYVAVPRLVDAPPAAMTVELVSMSPDPGGQANGGSPASGAAGARQVSSESQGQTRDDATSLDAIVTDAGGLTTAVFRTPPPKPRKPKRPAVARKDVSPPAPTPQKQTHPPSPSPPSPEAGSATPAGFGSAHTKSPAGHGSGSAGARKGPRFRLGAPGNPIPKYPERARRQGYEGRVVLAVQVSAEGEPLSVRIAKSSGYSILDEAARRTIRRWRFGPAAESVGANVGMVRVPITFRLEEYSGRR